MKFLILTLILLLGAFTASAERITDFGAVPNDGISDAQAIQDALASVEQGCGGEVVIPKGEFLVDDTIATNFSHCGWLHLTLRGEPGAELRISTTSQITFIMSSLLSLQVKDITFLGVNVAPPNSAFYDASMVFQVFSVGTAVFDHVNFYGLAVTQSMIRALNTNLTVTHAQFSGSLATYPDGAYILGDKDTSGNGWQSITVNECEFIDYVNYKTGYLNKTPYVLTGAYIRTTAPNPGGAARTRGKLEVRNSTFDEGANASIVATDTPYVVVSEVAINLNIGTNATGIRLTNVESAEVDRSIGDWAAGYFITTNNVTRVRVSLLTMKAGAHFWRNLGHTYLVQGWCPGCDP